MNLTNYIVVVPMNHIPETVLDTLREAGYDEGVAFEYHTRNDTLYFVREMALDYSKIMVRPTISSFSEKVLDVIVTELLNIRLTVTPVEGVAKLQELQQLAEAVKIRGLLLFKDQIEFLYHDQIRAKT